MKRAKGGSKAGYTVSSRVVALEKRRKKKRPCVLYQCVSPELIHPSGVTDVTTKSEEYLAPDGQVELDPAKLSPPGQDQVLSLGTSVVETLIVVLTLY